MNLFTGYFKRKTSGTFKTSTREIDHKEFSTVFDKGSFFEKNSPFFLLFFLYHTNINKNIEEIISNIRTLFSKNFKAQKFDALLTDATRLAKLLDGPLSNNLLSNISNSNVSPIYCINKLYEMYNQYIKATTSKTFNNDVLTNPEQAIKTLQEAKARIEKLILSTITDMPSCPNKTEADEICKRNISIAAKADASKTNIEDKTDNKSNKETVSNIWTPGST